jgi:hypothetical protein
VRSLKTAGRRRRTCVATRSLNEVCAGRLTLRNLARANYLVGSVGPLAFSFKHAHKRRRRSFCVSAERHSSRDQRAISQDFI